MTDENAVSPSVPPTPRHIRVKVPSNCVFYGKDVTSIFACPFDVNHIAAMSTAKNSQDLPAFIRAIGATLNVPIESLTQDDFYAVCFWHRINSYPSKPLTLSWTCGAVKHVELANKIAPPNATPELLEEIDDAKKGLKNRKSFAPNHPIEINEMTQARFTKMATFLKDKNRKSYPHIFYAPTVGDMIEFAEMTKLALRNKRLSDLELSEENIEQVLDEVIDVTADNTIVDIATHLNPTICGATLEQRMDYIREHAKVDPDTYNSEFLDDLETFKELCDHSVSEIIKCKCAYRGCGQQVEIPLNFDLFNFFPFV